MIRMEQDFEKEQQKKQHDLAHGEHHEHHDGEECEGVETFEVDYTNIQEEEKQTKSSIVLKRYLQEQEMDQDEIKNLAKLSDNPKDKAVVQKIVEYEGHEHHHQDHDHSHVGEHEGKHDHDHGKHKDHGHGEHKSHDHGDHKGHDHGS